MSKYIYTTIYEQFTGLKPPEPKDHKSRRRRGFGHPYRMRLNMQEDATHTHNNSKLRSERDYACLLYTSPSPRDLYRSRMPSSA